jgi:hypothetical protein
VLKKCRSQEKDTDQPSGNSKIVVNEITPAQVLYTMISLQASIEANGHGSVLNHGFCYSLESNPDKSDSIVNLGVLSKEESFSATINNLAPATKYFFRAFADIPSGTIWSKEFSFLTLKTGKPLLVTDSVYSVSVSAASFSGTIVADSGLAITRRGFSWGKNSFPGMLDSISEISGTTNNFTFKLQGLEFATKYYFKAFAENQDGISFGSTLEFETLADIPSVTTGEAHSITQTAAVCAGEVTSDGGAWVAARGICWGMTENPTIFGEHSSEGNGTGQFETTLSNLTPSATYYYRAYASNSSGIAYGAQRSFKTTSAPVLPVVNTAAITNITTNYALSGGNVTSDGGLTVTAKGLCWGTKPSPTLKDSFSNDGSGTGSFITNIINLTPGTTYYVRAYATNSLGTAFGNELSFTTETAHTIPTVITTTVTSITSSSAVSGGNVTNTGGDAVTSRGVCWSTTQNPTLSNSHTIDGSGSGSFTSNLTGLSPSTTYYIRAYATNISGTAYGQQLSFTTSATVVVPSVITANITLITSNSALSGGNISSDGGASVTARGVCYSTTPSPTLSNSFTTDGNGTGTFSSEISGLNANTTYYVRAYATNSAGTAYGDQKSFTTLANATTPTVSTAAISSITSSSAVSGGNVTSTGGASVTARGVCWSTSQNPTIFNSHTTDGSGAGLFVSNLTGLSPSTIYYVRAYATNSQGTAYGNQLYFTTSANVTLPSVTTAAITNITSSSATSGGNVTSSGGATVTARGVCWSTNPNPTLSNNFTTNGSGTGSFVSNLTGLNPSTTYYVRAYATNSEGTSYGNQESFTTLEELTIPTVTTTSVTNITSSTATGGGNVTSSGGATVTARGVCWSTNPNPTLNDDFTLDGSGTGSFVSNLSGLSPTTTYYVRAYATNSEGTNYGDQILFVTYGISTWLGWDDGVNADAIGLQGGGTFNVAVRFTPAQLAQYAGTSLTKIRMFPYGPNGLLTLKVWTGANASILVLTQPVTSYVAGQWNEFALDSPIPVTGATELWFGYTVIHTGTDYVAGCDNGPAVSGFGDMISLDGSVWESMATQYGLNYNWNLEGYVETVIGEQKTLSLINNQPIYNSLKKETKTHLIKLASSNNSSEKP